MKSHIVAKLDMTGRLLMTLGERDVPGEDVRHFNRPTDVAVAPDGSFFVSDGYGNSRIVKFDKDGKYIKAWGNRGAGKGQLHLPHALVIDGQGLVYVADRENKRIQVFDADGKFIRLIDGMTPYGICLAPDGKLYIADGRASTVTRMTLAGGVELSWGAKGSGPGEFNMPHGIAVGSDGSVYVAEINGERLQKFEPR
jgi:DNA-binding beta-propeller fold protein YncE